MEEQGGNQQKLLEDTTAILREYVTNLKTCYYLFPSSMFIASLMIFSADPSWTTGLFALGYIVFETTNITINLSIGLKDAEQSGNSVYGRQSFSHTLQGFGYVLGFFSVY